MPYHSSNNSPKNSDKIPSKIKQNIINAYNLTPAKKNKLMNHANHHSLKHIKMMADFMTKKKMSFIDSHKNTMKKIGK
tara:strand:+ start:57 stop:290 length:234 start_codon:yes stop_codon:yes gene_type:complete